jgi:hypothetical protein
MRISHICHECGFDTVRTPAPPDPVYGLPVVRCRCGVCHVRCRENQKTMLGAIAAYVKLGLRMVALAFFVGIPCVSLVGVGADMWSGKIRGGAFGENLRKVAENDVDVLVVCLMMAVFAGSACAWLLRYRGAYVRTLMFGGVMLISCVFIGLTESVRRGTILDPAQFGRALVVLSGWSVLVSAVFGVVSVCADAVLRLGVFQTRLSTRLAKERRKRR